MLVHVRVAVGRPAKVLTPNRLDRGCVLVVEDRKGFCIVGLVREVQQLPERRVLVRWPWGPSWYAEELSTERLPPPDWYHKLVLVPAAGHA